MNRTSKTRLYLFIGSSLTIILVAAFLFILNINEPSEHTAVPFSVLIILTIISCVAMALFYAKGPVFNVDGELESANINAMLVTVLIIIQVSFFFETISVKIQIINYNLYSTIRADIGTAQKSGEESLNDTLKSLCREGITEVAITDKDDTVLFCSDEAYIGEKIPESKYSYVYDDSRNIRFLVNNKYYSKQINSMILNLITVLVTSIFFSVEMVLLMIGAISRNMGKLLTENDESIPKLSKGENVISSLYYIRQISFLFYLSSRLSSAFIPTMAKSLFNPFPWLSVTAAARLPQSVETLLTCSAIFITTLILEKKGWKLPFMLGLLMVAGGTFLSAISTNLVLFILARAVVGLGYGFCWMTLRNLSLFGKTNKDRLLGFALLNAGIYAGMNCGASLGAILADIFGYKTVFIISAVLTLLTSLFIIRMENALLPKKEETEVQSGSNKEKLTVSELMPVILSVILMIAPASIAASYLSYYLPLYFEETGYSVTDVGRAQLLYGIVIVYAGPFLSAVISSLNKHKQLRNLNIIYNIAIALSLFLPGLGAGLVFPFLGAALLGTADSFGFGVQNNYFLSFPAIKALGASKSLSVLSFIKKILEMTGPLIFAGIIVIGYQAGIRTLALIFAVMAGIYAVYCISADKKNTGRS